MSGFNISKCLAFIILLAIVSCASDEDKKSDKQTPVGKTAVAQQEASQQAVQTGRDSDELVKVTPEGQSASPLETRAYPKPAVLDPEKKEKADKLLNFANGALNSLQRNYYSLGDILPDNGRRYMETWRLPKTPKVIAKKESRQHLTPQKGIFDEEEEKQLTAALDGMDKALEKMLAPYAELEKYLADDRIRDDGRKGRALIKSLEGAHASFLKSKDSWLAIVEKRAASAEQYLLQGHPLQRQIIDAQKMFFEIRQIGNLLKTENPDPQVLLNLRQSLQGLRADAAKPPFPASPALERLYRDFLKKIAAYGQTFDRAFAEGFHSLQKKELAQAARNCGDIYNEFIKAVNKLSERGRK